MGIEFCIWWWQLYRQRMKQNRRQPTQAQAPVSVAAFRKRRMLLRVGGPCANGFAPAVTPRPSPWVQSPAWDGV